MWLILHKTEARLQFKALSLITFNGTTCSDAWVYASVFGITYTQGIQIL